MNYYPVIILDVGVSFKDRRIMKKMKKTDIHDLPWHTPLFTSIAYRIWEDKKSSGDLLVAYSLPPDFIPEKEREEYKNRIAAACDLELSEYLDLATPLVSILRDFIEATKDVSILASHNIDMDILFLKSAARHSKLLELFDSEFEEKELFCTMKEGMEVSGTLLPGRRPRWPKLWELERALTGSRTEKIKGDVVNDLEIVDKCYHLLVNHLGHKSLK